MSVQLEQFTGVFTELPRELLMRLDRNFRKLTPTEPIFAVSQAFTFSDTDSIESLQVDASAAAITITLPAPTGSRTRRVIKTDASANAVTVSGGGHNINGAGTVVLAAQYDRVTVEPTGTSWLRID